MSTLGWARCIDSSADVLRRGAWYQILEETENGDVFVEVDRNNRVRVSRVDLHIRQEPPTAWSIVMRTGVMRPTWSGAKVVTTYAVCPRCRERQEFEGKPDVLQCNRCEFTGEVDWTVMC